MKQKELTKFLQENYPESLASSFDLGKIGLQFGSEDKEISKVMITLDATKDVIDEALENKWDLIISHHPFMFNPMLSLNYDSIFGKKILKVLDNRLNLYSLHTNFDTAIDGMNYLLANKLGLLNISAETDEINQSSFIRTGEITPMKLIDFVKYTSVCLEEDFVKFIGDPNKIIKKVGIVGGSGTSEFRVARNTSCDCFITGEIKHNIALDTIDYDFSMIEVSHFVEALFKEPFMEKLKKAFPNIEFILSKKDTNPFSYYVKK